MAEMSNIAARFVTNTANAGATQLDRSAGDVIAATAKKKIAAFGSDAAALTGQVAKAAKPLVADLPKVKLSPLDFIATATTPGAKLDAPRLSRDGKMVVYNERVTADIPMWMKQLLGISKDGPTEKMRTFVAPVDGSVAPRQIAGKTFHNVVEPTFTPDGKSVLYCQQKNYPFLGPNGFGEKLKDMRLDQVDLATGKVTNIYNGEMSLLHPQYSPDGRYIATYSRTPGKQGIYLLDTQNLKADPKRVMSGVFDDKHPVWSEDGKRIYFHNQKGGDAVDDRGDDTEQAWVGYINMADPKNPKRVMLDDPTQPSYHKHPAPIPGSDLVAYHDDDHKIEVMNMVTGQRGRLSFDHSLSPNGSPVTKFKHVAASGDDMLVLGNAKKGEGLDRGTPETWRLYMEHNTTAIKTAFESVFPPAAPAAAAPIASLAAAVVK